MFGSVLPFFQTSMKEELDLAASFRRTSQPAFIRVLPCRGVYDVITQMVQK